MKTKHSISFLMFVLVIAIGYTAQYLTYGLDQTGFWILGISVIAALLLASSINIANQWDRAIVLRLGYFRGMRGPGLFVILPFIDRIACWIDNRVIPTSFKAEKTLTKDTVPVDVDAVLF